jgi:hypothetical protein
MNENSSVKRSRRTSAEVAQLVSEYELSGMGQKKFCELHDLAPSTLRRGLGRHRGVKGAGPLIDGLIGVDVVEKGEFQRKPSASGLEVIVTKGRRIEIGMDFDGATLQRLVDVLERI